MNYKKIFTLFFLFSFFAHASWVQDYQKGVFKKDQNKIYSFVQKDISQNNYKTKAFQEAVSDISSQLFTYVSSNKSLNKTSTNDRSTNTFEQTITTSSSLPILNPKKEKELQKGNNYYLLVSFDKLTTASKYKQKANDIVKTLDKMYKDYKLLKTIDQKELHLQQMASKLQNYKKYYNVSQLLNSLQINKPKVSEYFIQTQFDTIYNQKASNIQELCTILVKNIKKAKLKNNIKVYPFSFESKQTFSSFSHDLLDNLTKTLSKSHNLTTRDDSLYKLKGNYTIKESDKHSTISVKTTLYDSFGDIVNISIASMDIPKNLLKKEHNYYIPKTNEYDIMQNLVLNPNLDVQLRINGQKKDLLFTQGDSVNIELKVSKESYIYIVGNIRSSDGKQLQYLLPLSDRIGKSKFQKHIPYQNSNLWVSLGEFEVYPPFGVEVLQVFASNHPLIDTLPHTKYITIGQDQYDVIVDEKNHILEASRSVQKLRALKLKTKKKIQKAEALIKFTTIKG